MIVFIKLPDKTKYDLDIDEKITVLGLKNIIYKKLQIDVLKQRLLYNGLTLMNDYCIYQYKIENNSVIHLLYQLY